MARPRPEPMQVVKQRRDAALKALVEGVPYIRFLNISFDRRGDELTGVLNFDEKLIGNPFLPAIHGGVTAAFLEVTAVITLSWEHLFPRIESGEIDAEDIISDHSIRFPKTIDFTVDVLLSALLVSMWFSKVVGLFFDLIDLENYMAWLCRPYR